MTEPEKVQWTRLSAEAVAIVASILFAFAIDAWWDEEQERENLRDLLVGLRDDLQQGKEYVAFRQEVAIAREKSIIELLEAAFDQDSKLSEASIDRLLSDMVWYFDDVPISEGGINSLIYSGILGSIENEKLRREIADWPRAIIYIRNQLKEDYDVYIDVWMPFMRDYGYLPQIYKTITHVPGHSELPYSGLLIQPKETINHSSLLGDKRFHNILVHLWDVQNNLQGTYDDAESRLDLSIRLIEEELAQ
jgi:hypothetical protein